MSQYEKYIFFFCLICIASLFKSGENTECISEPVFLGGTEPQQVELKNKCSVFVYENETLSDKSISRIVLNIIPTEETFSGTSATVTIEEYSNKEEKYVPVNGQWTWTIYSNKTFKRSHFSRSATLKITFKTTENWTNSTVWLCYEEVKFESFVRHSSEEGKNEITPKEIRNETGFEDYWHYRPNSNYIFHIDRNINLSSTSNIKITLHELDIDRDMGEYLLIGAGFQPFDGPPPLCITEAVGKKKYLVADVAAYIVFVTNATRRNYKGFNISFDYEGTAIKRPEINEKEDVKNSAPICIYNMTAAEEEFKKPGDYFKEFRENFAEVATDYARNLSKHFNSSEDYISASSVSIFRISGIFKNYKSQEALYSMVKITKDSTEGKAEFNQYQLEEIISIYSKKASSKVIDDSFEFRECGARYVPESWFYFGLILIIPVICFALILWIWKQNPIAEHYEKKRKLKRAPLTRRSQQEQSLNHKYYDVDNCDFSVQSASENHYTTLPKVLITNELGRRTTLNLSDTLLCGDNASDDELFNKLYTHKRRSDVLELQRMQRTNALFLTNEGEDNAAFEMEQENNVATEQLQHEDRADHTYESVRSSASLCETTKL